MKKTYIVPKMEATEINMVSMIAASDPKVITEELDPEEADSRKYNNVWDDEEEEEDF